MESAEITDPRLKMPVGYVLDHRWKIEKILGENNFGAGFYEVVDILRPTRLFTLKVESNAPNVRNVPRFMPLELLVFSSLKDNSASIAPFLEFSGENERFKFMVTTPIGLSLKELQKKQGQNRFSLRTCLHVAQQSILSLKELHQCGFIHRDIKPANIAVSKNGKQIYFFNFELSRKYVSDEGRMHKSRNKTPFRGTTLYASTNALKQMDQSRADDLWALFYSLIEITTGMLPWDEEKIKKTIKGNFIQNLILAKENALRSSQLFSGCPEEYKKIVDHISTLEFEGLPNYSYLLQLISDCMLRYKYDDSVPLDWELAGGKAKQ